MTMGLRRQNETEYSFKRETQTAKVGDSRIANTTGSGLEKTPAWSSPPIRFCDRDKDTSFGNLCLRLPNAATPYYSALADGVTPLQAHTWQMYAIEHRFLSYRRQQVRSRCLFATGERRRSEVRWKMSGRSGCQGPYLPLGSRLTDEMFDLTLLRLISRMGHPLAFDITHGRDCELRC